MYRQFFNKLPKISEWTHTEIKWYLGDSVEDGKEHYETLHFWSKDVMDVIQELLENPEFKNNINYTPIKIYIDKEKSERIFNKGFTADLWHEIMVFLKKLIVVMKG